MGQARRCESWGQPELGAARRRVRDRAQHDDRLAPVQSGRPELVRRATRWVLVRVGSCCVSSSGTTARARHGTRSLSNRPSSSAACRCASVEVCDNEVMSADNQLLGPLHLPCRRHHAVVVCAPDRWCGRGIGRRGERERFTRTCRGHLRRCRAAAIHRICRVEERANRSVRPRRLPDPPLRSLLLSWGCCMMTSAYYSWVGVPLYRVSNHLLGSPLMTLTTARRVYQALYSDRLFQ